MILLVAIWLPASSHTLLQNAGLIHEQHELDHDEHSDINHHADSDAPHEHDGDNHAAADGFCLLSSGKVQVPAPVLVAAPGWLMVARLTQPVEESGALLRSGLSPPGLAPPEFQHRWQFFFRAALPARAPSLIS